MQINSTSRPPRQDGAVIDVDVIELDGRGLEPPGPLMMVLAALGRLRAGGEMRFRTDRRPLLLDQHLLDRKCRGVTREEPDGSYLTIIRRA